MKREKDKRRELIGELIVLSEKLNRKPVKRDDKRLYRLIRLSFGSWNNGLKKAGFKVKDKQSPRIPDIKERELYYFLGLLITDGHIAYNKGKNYQIKLYTSYEEEKEMILRLIDFLFDYKASVRQRKTGFNKRINYEIFISSKKLCEFILEFSKIPPGAKSNSIKIPNLLFSLSEDKIAEFLRGVIDGDGTILKNKVVKIVSGSEEFLFGIKRLLDKLETKSGQVCQERESLYNLWICGKDNLKKLKETLRKKQNNFSYPRKAASWNQYI